MYVVVATWRAKEGAEGDVAATLAELTPLVRQEPGCLRFVANRSRTDPRTFLIYEQYTDERAFDAHRATPHFARDVMGRAVPLLEERSVESYHVVEAANSSETMAQAGAPTMISEQLSDNERAVRLLLLRHGQMSSHEGDMPLTTEGEETAQLAGARTVEQLNGALLVLSSDTKRTRQSADLFTHAARATGIIRTIDGPRHAFALRNPDLYLAGERVDMVSTPEALAQQVPQLSPAQCAAHPFFSGFMAAPDRIGWWLQHPAPPGEDARAVTSRILPFARSLGDPEATGPLTVVAITHSPIIRAVATTIRGTDVGEPSYLTGLCLDVTRNGEVSVADFDPFAG